MVKGRSFGGTPVARSIAMLSVMKYVNAVSTVQVLCIWPVVPDEVKVPAAEVLCNGVADDMP